MGQKHARFSGRLTENALGSQRLVRLPLWLGLESKVSRVIEQIDCRNRMTVRELSFFSSKHATGQRLLSCGRAVVLSAVVLICSCFTTM